MKRLVTMRALTVALAFLCVPLRAADWDGGITAGVTVTAGTHTRRLGLFVAAWAGCGAVQFNPGVRAYRSFRNLGPEGSTWEFDGYAGVLFAWGRRDGMPNPFITSVSNHTLRRYSVAYAHNVYRDGLGTSQRTGTIGMQFNRLSVTTENDLIGDNKDRYRTASATVQYRYGGRMVGASMLIWTGEKGKRVTGSTYPARNGYKEQGRFGTYSHGILCLQVQREAPFGQTVQFAAGIDAEQIRHAFQNRMIHDMAFLPAAWVRNPSSHVPMLTGDGAMYLYGREQVIRRPKPYYSVSINPSGGY